LKSFLFGKPNNGITFIKISKTKRRKMSNIQYVGRGGGAAPLFMSLGPAYTTKHTNKHIAQQKAYAFKLTWEDLKKGKSITIADNPSDAISKEAWEDYYTNLVAPTENNKKRFSIMCDLEAKGIDLLHADEQTVRAGLELVVKDDRNIKRPTYMKGLVSQLRQGLMALGRIHAFGEGEQMDFLGNPLVDSNNPMTKPTQDYFDLMIKEKEKQTKKAMPESDDKTDAREGAPASLALVYFLILRLLHNAIFPEGKINQVSRLVNLLSLALLLMMLIHEVSRPGDCYRELLHEHLYLPLHDKVYMLTFAFLKPATFAFFLENDLLQKYGNSFYKGKQRKIFLERLKATMPLAQNGLDMMVMYVVVMRLILMLDPSALCVTVFKNTSWIQQLRSHASKIGLMMLTFYSLRYAHAEEMNKGGIMSDVIRTIMGHVYDSDINLQYANNKDKRVKWDGAAIPLGTDLMGHATDESLIPLEFNIVNGSLVTDSAFLDNITEPDMRAEFVQVSGLVSSWIEKKDESAKATLLDIIRIEYRDPAPHKVREVRKKAFKSYLSFIPMGFNFKFPAKALPDRIQEEFVTVQSSLQAAFKKVVVPPTAPSFLVWSLPQVVFGNWRKAAHSPLPPKTLIVPPPTFEVCMVPSVIPKFVTRPVEPKAKKPKVISSALAKRKEVPESDDEEWDIIPENIEKGDLVIILCPMDQEDKYSFFLPAIPDRKVWLARAVSYTGRTKRFVGVFMFNESHIIADPWQSNTLKDKQSVIIEDMDVMEILSPTDEKPITSLEDDEVHNIERNIRKVQEIGAKFTHRQAKMQETAHVNKRKRSK